MELKSLYFNLIYVLLFSAKTRIYKENTRTYTQSGAENSLFQFCLTITKPLSPFLLFRLCVLSAVSQVIMRVDNRVAYRCIQISSAVKTPREHLDVLL